jgi:hypothetical protein
MVLLGLGRGLQNLPGCGQDSGFLGFQIDWLKPIAIEDGFVQPHAIG